MYSISSKGPYLWKNKELCKHNSLENNKFYDTHMRSPWVDNLEQFFRLFSTNLTSINNKTMKQQ